ncbi:MAG: hypothetical protein ACYDD1_06795 [Caulobacteraceae bacterium]
MQDTMLRDLLGQIQRRISETEAALQDHASGRVRLLTDPVRWVARLEAQLANLREALVAFAAV